MTSVYEGLVPCPHRAVDESGRILCGLIKGGDREVSVNLCRACPVPLINCRNLRAAMQKKTSTPITVRFATGRVEVWDDEAPTIGFKQAACAVKTMPIHSARDCAGCPLRVPQVVPQTAIQIARRTKPAASAESNSIAVSAVGAGRGGTPPPTYVTSQRGDPGKSAETEAARELVQRAQALKVKDSRERARSNAPSHSQMFEGAAPAEPVSKIILFQQWLADQFSKKDADPSRTPTTPDEGGVQEIVYSRPPNAGPGAIAQTYHEEPAYERCVGWTD